MLKLLTSVLKQDYKFSRSHLLIFSLGLIIAGVFLLAVVLAMAILIAIMFIPTIAEGVENAISATGNLGDTINGIIGPAIAILAVLTTFLAFLVQYEANNNQREDISRERFESKFYEMLRLHRSNIEEMEIDGIRGKFKSRKLVMRMFYEFKFIYYSFKWKAEEIDETIEEILILQLSYRLFFHGINDDVGSSLNMEVEKGSTIEGLYNEVYDHLDEVRANYISHKYDDELKGDHDEEIVLKNGKIFKCKFLYYPFDGHTNRLAHYYRHLYQMVKFIINENQIRLSKEERYGFLKMIRSQLSNYEQLLLFYNAFVYGKPWIEEQLFSEHRMIKNLPLRLADFGVTPHSLLGVKNQSGEFIFEDDEYEESK